MNFIIKLFLSITLLSSSVSMLAQSSSDIATVIKTFTNANKANGFVAWGLYNTNKSMHPHTTNIVASNSSPFEYFMSSKLTMNGVATYKNEVGKTGSWDIALYGPRVGADILYLDATMSYASPDDVVEYLIKKLYMTKYKTISSDEMNSSIIYKSNGSYIKIETSNGAMGGFIAIYVAKSLESIE